MAVNKNMKVLVVDDYATMRRILRNLLNQLGFNNVEMASDGPSALTMLLTDDYGLVIADWDMEPVTGLQLLKEVRALAYSTGKSKAVGAIPFILLSADAKTDRVIAAKEAGVSNYIVKPFNAETLKAKLVSVIGDF